MYMCTFYSLHACYHSRYNQLIISYLPTTGLTIILSISFTDQTYRKATPQAQWESSLTNQQVWQELYQSHPHPPHNQSQTCTHPVQPLTDESISQTTGCKHTQTRFFPSLDQATQWCCSGRGVTLTSTSPHKLTEVEPTPSELMEADHVQVLVTGSVRLVGVMMFILDCSIG